jgi:hypothetical protein
MHRSAASQLGLEARNLLLIASLTYTTCCCLSGIKMPTAGAFFRKAYMARRILRLLAKCTICSGFLWPLDGSIRPPLCSSAAGFRAKLRITKVA